MRSRYDRFEELLGDVMLYAVAFALLLAMALSPESVTRIKEAGPTTKALQELWELVTTSPVVIAVASFYCAIFAIRVVLIAIDDIRAYRRR